MENTSNENRAIGHDILDFYARELVTFDSLRGYSGRTQVDGCRRVGWVP